MADALIIRQKGKPQELLERYVRLLLNYRYGRSVETVADYTGATHVLRREGQGIHVVFVIQDTAVSSRNTIPVLSGESARPVILLQPANVAAEQREACAALGQVRVCAWEEAFRKGESSLQSLVIAAMSEEEQLEAAVGGQAKDEDAAARIQARLDSLDTLPTLPVIALRIMHLAADPKSTTAQLEEMLCRDPALILKLLRVVNSPAFAGAGHKGKWTLREAIVRLGARKVGAMAQQVALINSLVRPEASQFELRRFWEHSVGCALLASRLYEGKHVTVKGTLEFNDYWIAALLHDGGKLVLGFFFWDWFERILKQMERDKHTFAEAEAETGGVTHPELGGLLLKKAKASPALIGAVEAHHAPGTDPLACLIHVADNLAKEAGLAYREKEPANYDRPALQALGLKREDARKLLESLGEKVADEVRAMVDACSR